MKDLFAYRTASGKTLGELIFCPLKERNIEPTVVDIGARNGMFLVPQIYALHAHYIGFEPNKEEYEKLVRHKTDAMNLGMDMPKFKSEEYHDCAVWSEDGFSSFYVTKGPGSCTLMGKTDGIVTSRMFLESDTQSYENTHSEIQNTISMKCKRLDSIINSARKIDFLKIDAEGADYEVLKGALDLLKSSKILFIKTEFQLFPYYDNHSLLGDQQILLSKYGFRLIDLNLEHSGYTRSKSRLPMYADRRLMYAGDAFFILDPDRNELLVEDRYRIALVSFIFGFNSLAISLLRETGYFSTDELNELEDTLKRRHTSKRWLYYWSRIPFISLAMLSKIKRCFR